MSERKDIFIHPSAVIDDNVKIGEGSKIWHFSHLRSDSQISSNVSLAKDVYIDQEVFIGKNTRIQNGVSVYKGVNIGDHCFIGPHVIFTNDNRPRIGKTNWKIIKTFLKDGCSIGAGAIIKCGIEIGEFSMIAAGSIVTKSIPPFSMAMGASAKVINKICACGETDLPIKTKNNDLILDCCKANLDLETYTLALKIINNKLKND